MTNYFTNANFAVMEKSLDALWQRQQVIANNISNFNTPGYKAKSLEFENMLSQTVRGMQNSAKPVSRQAALDRINALQPAVLTDTSTEARVDGNNVDIDKENVELARVKLQYDYMVRKITDQFNLLKLAINEGKG